MLVLLSACLAPVKAVGRLWLWEGKIRGALHLEHQLQGLQMRRTGSNTDVTAYAPRNVNKLPQQHFEADGFIGHGPALITVRRNELDIWMLRE